MVSSDEKDMNWFLCLSVLSANLISFTGNTGYPWTSPFLAKLNGKVDPERNPLLEPLTLLEESWITSLHSLGALCGLLLAGPISEHLGKKKSLIFFSVPMFLSNVLLIFADSVIEFYVSRFLLGVGTACVFSVVPTYIAEITTIRNRGKAGMIMSLMSSLSHVFTVSVGPYVTISTFAYLSLVPSILFFVIFVPFVPESPYYHLSRNRLDEAETSLRKLRRRDDVKMEMEEIMKTVKETTTRGSFKEIINSKTVIKSLLISFGLIFCQQLTGCQAVTSYQQEIFTTTSDFLPSHLSVILVGIFQLLSTILVISIIDKVGRKVLLLTSFFGLFVSLASLGTYFYLKEENYNVEDVLWLPLLSLVIFMVFFRLGAGPVCWTIIGEIFPSNLKGYLSGVVTCEAVVFGFVISMVYPQMVVIIGMAWTFWVFALGTGMSLFVVWFVVPEIKGKSFLEIQELLNK